MTRSSMVAHNYPQRPRKIPPAETLSPEELSTSGFFPTGVSMKGYATEIVTILQVAVFSPIWHDGFWVTRVWRWSSQTAWCFRNKNLDS